MGAIIHRPGEGENLDIGISLFSTKATGEETDGKYWFSISEVGPKTAGPPLHVHREWHDTFYILEGALTFQVEDDLVEAPAGTFVCVQPGTRHTFANRTDATVKVLNLIAPAGFENYIRELSEAWDEHDGAPPLEAIGELIGRYDIELVGPPLEV